MSAVAEMRGYTLLDDNTVHACLFTAMGEYFAVDPRSGSCLRISEELFRWAVSGTDPLARCSIAWRLEQQTRLQTHNKRSTVPTVIVFVTHRCNLFCPYCYDRFSARAGSCDVGAVCKAILSSARDGRVRVHFFGGEPMLEWNRIRDTMERCRGMVRDGLLSDAAYSITTNGTLLNKDAVDFFNQNQFNVRVSADGYSDGSWSWGAPVKVIDDVRLTWVTFLDSCAIRCTVLPGCASDIVDMVSLWWDHGVSRVAFAPAIDESVALTSSIRDEYLALLHGLAHAIREGRFPASYIENFDRVRSMIGRGRYGDEGAWDRCDVHAIDVDGRMFSCHRLVAAKSSQSNRQPSSKDCPRCTECWARALCQGLCRYELQTCDAKSLSNLCKIYMTEVELGVWGAARCQL